MNSLGQNKAEELVKQLKLEEKISLLSETAPAIERLGIRRYHHGNEALHGVVRPGKFTVFPQAIGMAASFHPGLVRDVGSAISDEARARHNENHGEMAGDDFDGLYNGLLTFWSPNLNVARDPRWGRTGETYGEDPHLAGACGTSFVRGLQGDREGILKTVATPKHFVANNEEHNRFECNADIPRDQYFDYYLKPFEIVIKEGKCEAVMAAYNAVDGVPCHANHELLTEILREEWGFEGYVVSDCGAVSHLVDRHGYAGTPQEAAAMALKAGVDLECGSCGTIQQVYRNYLAKACEEGLVAEEDIDRAVFRVLKAREKLGILDGRKTVYDSLGEEVIGCARHQELACTMAEESLVLLKNEINCGSPVLPIKKGKRICVIGCHSDSCQFGDYSGTPVNEPVSILGGLLEEFGEDAIHYVPYRKVRVSDHFQTLAGDFLWHYEDGQRKPGLSGVYDSLKEEKPQVRIDRQIEFEWENMAPDPLIQQKAFQICWDGIVLPKSSGTYQFSVTVNDKECACKGRYRLQVDGRPAHLDEFYLEAGREYPLHLEYENTGKQPSVTLMWRRHGGKQLSCFEEELQAADECEVVLACIGLGTEYEAEGRDKTDLNLPKEQTDMLKEVYAVNQNLVVTLYNGSSLTIPWIASHAKGILECWYPGEQGGRAIARVLSGKVNPSGRLPLTFYKNAQQLPSFQCYDISKGFTYWYAKDVQYPFGYGLSYTSFEYSRLEVNQGEETLTGAVRVRNSGDRPGYEVVQIYVRYLDDEKAPGKLAAFSKIWLEPGEERAAEFAISDVQLAVYDSIDGRSRVREGCYMISAAGDSAHMKCCEERTRVGLRWTK